MIIVSKYYFGSIIKYILYFSRSGTEARPQGATTEPTIQGGAAVKSEPAGETEDARPQHGSRRSQTGTCLYQRDFCYYTQLSFFYE